MSDQKPGAEGAAGSNGRTIRVASWPHWYGPNPYLPLLYEALRESGVLHVAGMALEPALFHGPTRQADVLHLHWLYPLWRTGASRGRRRIADSLSTLRGIRAAGTPIIWTVHNLEPHDGFRRGEHEAYRAIYRLADLCVFHSRHALEAAESSFGPTEADRIVMPHGLLGAGFPPPGDRDEVRRREGVSDDDVLLLCFGQVRHNKGFDTAVAAARQLGVPYRLLVAGRAIDRSGRRMQRMARGAPNVSLTFESISDQRLSDLLRAADVVLLPYRSVTSSGALLHALSVATGIVTSDLPYFREVLGAEPDAGRLFPPDDPQALARAVVDCLAVPKEGRVRAIARLRGRLSWPACVKPLAAWLAQRSPKLRRVEV